MSRSKDLQRILRKLDRVGKAPRQRIEKALLRYGNQLADQMETFAPEDTGDLKDSITVTPPGHATPAYSQPGGSRVAGPTEVLVTAGNTKTRYAHLVEYFNKQYFFWVAYRLHRRRIKAGLSREGRKSIREAFDK